MKYLLGVDGGGTRTRAVVIDERANVQGLGYSGSSNYDDVGVQQAQTHLHAAIRQACASVSGPCRLSAAYLGIAGVVAHQDRLLIREMLEQLELAEEAALYIDHDCCTALAGALGGEPGVVVIAGTGSSCYGRNAIGETCLCGGWGYLLDDLGSSYFLGQQALVAVVRAHDGRAEETQLSSRILDALQFNDIRAILHRIYHPRPDRAGIAALAPIVTELAFSDAVARSIVERGCEELIGIVASVVRKLKFTGAFPIVPMGGLAASSSIFSELLKGQLTATFPEAIIAAPRTSALAGAAILALQESGVDVDRTMLQKLENIH